MSRARAMALHPAGPLTEDGIEARRRALEAEEEGLAGLVPVDRILAVAGGIIGGAITLTVMAYLELHTRRLRQLNARDDARP